MSFSAQLLTIKNNLRHNADAQFKDGSHHRTELVATRALIDGMRNIACSLGFNALSSQLEAISGDIRSIVAGWDSISREEARWYFAELSHKVRATAIWLEDGFTLYDGEL